MNEFEFMRSLPFGPYLETNSPIHRLDPRTRLLALGVFLVILTVAQRPLGLFLGLLVMLAGWWLARIPLEPLRRGWVSALPFLLILAVLQILFRVGPESLPLLQLGTLVISVADLWAGLILLLRFSAYMALLGLGAAVLSEVELTQGLSRLLKPFNRLHLPVSDIVFAVQVTLRFFPLLAQTAERIAKAQASRGADWRPSGWNPLKRAQQVMPLIVPLFVTSLRRAENMALAMDARGYGSMPERTSLITLRFHRNDLWASLVVLVISAAILFL
jgi:energy-coupling factor transport system permease protein